MAYISVSYFSTFNIFMRECSISALSFQLKTFHCSTLCAKIPKIQPYWPIRALSKDLVPIRRRGERGGSVVECRTPEREVGGSKPTAAVLCP